MAALPIAVHQNVDDQLRATRHAYAGVLLFVLVYCARPEDWILGAAHIPFAKIVGFFSVAALLLSLDRIRRRLPREVTFLVLLFAQLCLTVPFSPIWRAKAFDTVLEFSKVILIVLVMTLTVTTLPRLLRLLFVESASMGVVAVVAVWKGSYVGGRLLGAFHGVYENPNELALAIALSLPIGLAFLLRTRKKFRKFIWGSVLLVMTYALFLTASRAGFLALLTVFGVSLWEFGVKGRRAYLLALTVMVSLVLWLSASESLKERLVGTFNPQDNVASAYGSARQRQQLLWRSLEITVEHPFWGVGPGNFAIISGYWKETHNSYTQVSAEAGIPAFILYVLILWRAFVNIRNVKRIARGRTELLLFAGALRASLSAYLVGSFFDSVAYLFFPYFLVAYTTALFWIGAAPEPAPSAKRELERLARSTDKLKESYG